MNILAIDTSCDETAVAITNERNILSNVTHSQILMHQEWGGVVPNLARRAHEENIDMVIETTLKKAKLSWKKIDYIAVTYGPGLAIALGVGIEKAKELSRQYDKKLIAINHMEGHIYSCFAQNSAGNPLRPFKFPYLCLLVSGGHTELVLFKNHLSYEIIGRTLDDAAGECLDKAARLIMSGTVYPGGPLIERLAKTGKTDFVSFPRPMTGSKDLNFSYSGLKTSLFNYVNRHDDDHRRTHLNDIAASFQEAVIDSLIFKLEQAIKEYKINRILIAGGVAANARLRLKARQLANKYQGEALFPTFKTLYGDNAAMIGVVANYKAEKGDFVKNLDSLDREARASL